MGVEILAKRFWNEKHQIWTQHLFFRIYALHTAQ